MNPKYAAKVKEEIDKLLHVVYIRAVKRATWLTAVVPLPFIDSILDTVAGHDCYSFLDGFSGYNQIRIYPDDQEKIAFVTEWGVFVAVVMMFGLKTTPATFQRIISEIFDDFIPTFMQVFLDDFTVYGQHTEHLQHLRLCLDRCRKARLSLNLAKCAFHVTSGALLGHIVSKEGITMDPAKVQAILHAPAPTTAKALNRFLGQIRWHSHMLRYLADFATPLHAAVHMVPFRWTEREDTVRCINT